MSGRVAFVVFDLGGVVCAFDPRARLHALERLTSLRAREIDDAIWRSGLDAAAERGAIAPSTLTVLLAEALGGGLEADTIRSAWSLAFVPDDDVLALLDRIERPTVLFSNNGPIVDACLDHELSRVRDRFAHVLLSWRLGATKPDRAAFDAVGAHLGAGPADLFFVDDSLANVDAARQLGWRAEVFRDVRALERSLAAAGALEP